MEAKEIVRYMLSNIEPRKEILKIPYGSDDAKTVVAKVKK